MHDKINGAKINCASIFYNKLILQFIKINELKNKKKLKLLSISKYKSYEE